MRLMTILFVFLIFQSPGYARHDRIHPLSEDNWKGIMEKAALLDETTFMPSLLPVIMANRDSLQLSDVQLNKFRKWRNDHYENMVKIMDEIIEKKVQFSIESLSTEATDEHLLAFQADIHRLQHELLKLRLSCRDIVMQTFTAEQWDNFAFIIADYPHIASFFSQVHASTPHTTH